MGKRVNRSQTARQSPASAEISSKEPAEASRYSFRWLLLGLCVVAFLLRCIHLLQTIEVPTLIQLLGDARGYFDWALKISGGDWYGSETFYQAPLYPYFLAVLIKLFGPSVTLIRLVQMVLGVAGVALIGLAGRKLFSEKVGLVSALMLAVYPPAIFYDGIIQKAALATFLLCMFLAACVYLQTERRYRYAVLTGISLALLVLTRENALLWTPLVPLWILLALDETTRRRWALVACYVGGLALILLPVAARNASLGGEWSPTTFQAGPNFYIGNHLQANGIYEPLVPGHGTPMYERADAERLAEQAVGHELSAREVSTFWMSEAWGDIRQAPGRWFQLMVAKTFMVFNRYEVPDVESMYIFREYSTPLKLSLVWHFGILCPLGIWGLFATWGQRRRLWLYHLLLLSMIAAVVLFFILGRYRNPVSILFLPFAAAGIIDIVARFRQRQGHRKLLIAVLLLSAVFCNIRVHEEDSLHASCYMNMGVSACQAGNLPLGIRLLQRSVSEFPELAEGYVNLGRAYMLNGQPALAAKCFQLGLVLEPRLIGAHIQLGEALEYAGDPEQAVEHYRRALSLDPTSQRALEALSRVRQGLPRSPDSE
ncbi:tetratricopeptide repeat protein [Roseiconus lacunae]|uniref:tetratricopeptide repeat protein n=1 Tax=Roseiconus lacunae TaxID=2605694 RepID=UPI00308D68DF|nr:tetratricopeptide repeat protein [Stieleria sp. HD01]